MISEKPGSAQAPAIQGRLSVAVSKQAHGAKQKFAHIHIHVHTDMYVYMYYHTYITNMCIYIYVYTIDMCTYEVYHPVAAMFIIWGPQSMLEVVETPTAGNYSLTYDPISRPSAWPCIDYRNIPVVLISRVVRTD